MELISIAAGTVGAAFLNEAVKFLWSEAGKIMDRYRTRQEKDAGVVTDPAPAELKLPARRVIDFAVVERRKKELLVSQGLLKGYAEGDLEITPDDQDLVETLRRLLVIVSDIYHEPPRELRIRAEQDIDYVARGGKAENVDATGMDAGSIDATQRSGVVEGTITNVRVGGSGRRDDR